MYTAMQTTNRINMPAAPGIFNVKEINVGRTKTFSLELVANNYEVPNRLYGNMPFYVDYYWRGFKRRGFRTGLLLTGSAGAGKTQLAKILCNKAIEVGLRIITLTNVKFSIELITYLETLNGIVFFFDEYSKTFNWQNQEKMLTLLSNTLAKERVVIMTENNRNTISEFIRNRPGRVLYSKHFGKIELATVIEYLSTFNLDKKFLDKFMDLYKRVTTFTFDHMSHIVEEHIVEPDIDFDLLIELLNLEGFSPSKIISLVDIVYVGDDVKLKEYKFDSKTTTMYPNLPRESILTSEGFFVWNVQTTIAEGSSKTLEVKRDNLTEYIDDTVKFIVDDFEITYSILLEKDVTVKITNNNDRNRPMGQPSFLGRFT